MKLRLFLFFSMASTLLAGGEMVAGQKPAAATQYTESSRAHFGIWTDPQAWKPDAHPVDMFTLQFTHSNPNMNGGINAETAVVLFESLPQHALLNSRTVSTNCNLVSQERRRVCGKDVWFLIMEGTMGHDFFTSYGYYYSGPEGSVQAVVFFETKDREVCKGLALDFLNGLQIGQPGAASVADHTPVPAIAPTGVGIASSASNFSGVASVNIATLNAAVPYRSSKEAVAKLKAILAEDPTKAVKRLQPLADKKDPMAMFLMAQFYVLGKGVPADPPRAVELMKRAAAAGLPLAEVGLASWYVSGYHVPKDWKEAERLLRKPCDAGLPDAQARLGEILLDTDLKRAIELIRKAADQSCSLAEFRLAICYAGGKGVEKDTEKEMKWLRQASLHGNNEATEALAERYWIGDDVPQDHAEAVKYFTVAARAGVPKAQDFLGYCLLKGDGTPTDKSGAVQWLQKAAEDGFADAQRNLGCAYARGLGVSPDRKQAFYWYEKAAKQGQVDGQVYVGLAYLNGVTVEKDVSTALDWLHKAADQNVPAVFYVLGSIYWRGTGVSQDHVEAAKWFRKGAEGGNGKCQDVLASCYFNGDGVEKDPDEAVKWVRKAAEAGVANAQMNLGLFYAKGFRTVPRNVSEAIEWIRKAAEQGDGKAQVQLGMAYVNGQATLERNPGEAARWFRLAAIHGSAAGENAFGYALAIGEGVQQDLVEAYKWYLLALAQNDADPKARAEINKKAILPKMTPEQIQEAERRAAAFIPEKEAPDEFDPFSFNAA